MPMIRIKLERKDGLVRVVRCKDCKHNQLPPTSANAMCNLWYGMTDLFGYCSSGERRDGDESE